MEIVNFTPWSALAGGVLIGSAAGLALLMNGKIAGISGVVARIFRRVPGDTAWRVAFLVGLVVGGAATFATWPGGARFTPVAGPALAVVAGLLVGFGTRFGGGCTSGHGVCGIARGSRRSVVATLTFIAAAMATVFVVRHVVGAA